MASDVTFGGQIAALSVSDNDDFFRLNGDGDGEVLDDLFDDFPPNLFSFPQSLHLSLHH
jgi:hypothetical protein